ncbi:MAG: 30S ribosomal protein S20 [Planctomycetes bacterium]|nr:30S ribosomal protein S20 [Planctomycetota bacterium]
MPTTISAKKRVRQNAHRRAINHWRKRRIKTQIKSFLQAIQEQDLATAEAAFRKTCGILDRIGCTSTLHRNTVARRKSRLARRLNALKQAASA